MILTDRDAVTLATWAPHEPTHRVRWRVVRPITENGMRAIDENLMEPGRTVSDSAATNKWRIVQEGYSRIISIVGNTDVMGDFVVASFVYHPGWLTKKFQIKAPQKKNRRNETLTIRRLKIIASAWQSVLGQPLDNSFMSFFDRHLDQEIYKKTAPAYVTDKLQDLADDNPEISLTYDPSMYVLLGVELPWLQPHNQFMEWLEGMTE